MSTGKARARAGSADGGRPLLSPASPADLMVNAGSSYSSFWGKSTGKRLLEDEDFSHIDLRLPEDNVAQQQGMLLIDAEAMKNGLSNGVIGTPLVRTVAAANVLS
jgi:hypothetical protein